jgi:anthranilate synthase component 2
MILVIDNYDSFTYNLVQYIGELTLPQNTHVKVIRNNDYSVADIRIMQPEKIILSPGPRTPREAGVCVEVIQKLSDHVPILGVCLGHQAIGEAFGGDVVKASKLMHGKTSEIHHVATGLFAGLPQNLTVMRYHSLVIEPTTLPKDLDPTAWATDRLPTGEEREVIMGVRHKTLPVYGVQFHPESIMTPDGKKMLQNFLAL